MILERPATAGLIFLLSALSLALAAQVSAVAAVEGASANAKYQAGVAVFTMAKGGLMYEASVGGQKFTLEPFGKKK